MLSSVSTSLAPFQGLVGIAQTAGQGSSGSVAGDIILRSQTNSLIDVAGTTIGKLSSTGLAVTGASSATGTHYSRITFYQYKCSCATVKKR